MPETALKIILDPKHKLFADTYIATGNASEAARVAGYTRKSAGITGYKLLKRPDVSEYIASTTAVIHEVQEQDLKERVTEELTHMAFANIVDFIRIDDEGLPQVDFSTATPEQLKAIASVKSKSRKVFDSKGQHIATEQESSFVLADKYRGLDALAKTLGMYKADEVKLTIDVADRLLSARSRLRRLSDGEEENFG